MNMRSKKYHSFLLHIRNLSLLCKSAHITEVWEGHFSHSLGGNNDLSTSTICKQWSLQNKSQIKPKYFAEFTTQHHKNCLYVSFLSQYAREATGYLGMMVTLSMDSTPYLHRNLPCMLPWPPAAHRQWNLKPQASFEILTHLSHLSLKRQLPNQKLLQWRPNHFVLYSTFFIVEGKGILRFAQVMHPKKWSYF